MSTFLRTHQVATALEAVLGRLIEPLKRLICLLCLPSGCFNLAGDLRLFPVQFYLLFNTLPPALILCAA